MRLAVALALACRTGALKPQPTRQQLLRGAALTILPLPAYADDLGSPAFKDIARARTTAEALGVEEKDLPQKKAPLRTYVDPLFDLTFPKDWFAIRRTIDGDIVRRGGVIFSAGNLRTAEVVTVELFQVKELLAQAEAGPYFPGGSIKKWNDLGKDSALGQFMCDRRDGIATNSARKQQIQARASVVVPGTLSVKGDVLQLDIATDIQGTTMRSGEAGTESQTPGIRRLQRARLTLLPGGTEVVGIVAGCLDDLWTSGEEQVLGDIVESFRIKEKSGSPILPA